MKRFHDFAKLHADVQEALAVALAKHSIDSAYQPLAVCAVLEAISSPLKFQLQATPLTKTVGQLGVKIYGASRLVCEVEQLKSPHSLIVNPLMDAIATVLLHRRSALSELDLFWRSLRVHLQRPRLTQAGVRVHASLEPAFQSALGYLAEGEVIRRGDDGAGWQLSETYVAIS